MGPLFTLSKHSSSLGFLPCTIKSCHPNWLIDFVHLPNTLFGSSKCNHPKLHKKFSSSPSWLLLNSTCSQTYYFSEKSKNKGWLGRWFSKGIGLGRIITELLFKNSKIPWKEYSKNFTSVVTTLLTSSANGETCYLRKLDLTIASHKMIYWAFKN